MSTVSIIVLSILGAVLLLLLWIERWPWHVLRLSTIRALRWNGLRYSTTGGIHGIIYARWGPWYIKMMKQFARVSGRRGKEWMETGYHGKVLTHELATAVITIDREVPLQDLGDQVIPYSRARDILLNGMTGFVLTDCVCKRDSADHRGKPCTVAREPYYTCMFVGDPDLCDFLIDKKPETSKRLSREEALSHLEEFHTLGLVHNAWFKSCIRDRFYVICNCCPCCCLGFEAMKYGIRQITPSGYVAVVDENKCAGCGACAAACPFTAIEMTGGGTEAKARVLWDRCYGCGVCVDRCGSGARSLALDKRKGLPMDVRKLADGEVESGSKTA